MSAFPGVPFTSANKAPVCEWPEKSLTEVRDVWLYLKSSSVIGFQFRHGENCGAIRKDFGQKVKTTSINEVNTAFWSTTRQALCYPWCWWGKEVKALCLSVSP